MSKERFITRRDFIRGTAGAALATALGAGAAPEARAEKTAKVVLIRDAKALNEKGEIQAENIQEMLDEAVKALLEEKEVGPSLAKADQTLGCRRDQEQLLGETAHAPGARGGNQTPDPGCRRPGEKYRHRRSRGPAESHLQKFNGPDQCPPFANPPLVRGGNLFEKLHHVRSRPLELPRRGLLVLWERYGPIRSSRARPA